MRKRKSKHQAPLKDYYAILGVEHNAELEDIRHAFRKLAHNVHPDRNSSPDAKVKFQELGEAYQTLKSTQKRNDYDARVITEYCSSMVGNFEEKSSKAKTYRSEFHRILNK